jgi:hypothetical protein
VSLVGKAALISRLLVAVLIMLIVALVAVGVVLVLAVGWREFREPPPPWTTQTGKTQVGSHERPQLHTLFGEGSLAVERYRSFEKA